MLPFLFYLSSPTSRHFDIESRFDKLTEYPTLDVDAVRQGFPIPRFTRVVRSGGDVSHLLLGRLSDGAVFQRLRHHQVINSGEVTCDASHSVWMFCGRFS